MINILNLNQLGGWRRRLSPQRKAYFEARDAADSARDDRQWPEAAEHYERALQIDGSLLDIAVQLGHAYKEMGRYDDAGIQYAKALRATPRDDDLYLQIGHLEKLKGNPVGALQNYLKAATLNEKNKNALREYEALSASLLSAWIHGHDAATIGGRDLTGARTSIEHTTAQSRPTAIDGVDVSHQVKTNQFAFRAKELEHKLGARLWS